MLTDTQKAQIRLYLGYPSVFRYKHLRLESVMDNLDAPAEALIAAALTGLATVEAAITSSGITSAGIKRVDEIEFFGSSAGNSLMGGLRKTGRLYVTRISIVLGVPLYSDVFGSNGYLGDSFFPGSGEPMAGGSGGGFYNLG